MGSNGITVRVKRDAKTTGLPLPAYQTEAASGLDLLAANAEDIIVAPGEVKLVPTGMYISIPPGYEAQIRPRSGLALKHGVTIVNAPGTIDSDYRGEVGVIIGNVGSEAFAVKRGMRIAQMVFQEVVRASLEEVEDLDGTERGEGGFGHTGVH